MAKAHSVPRERARLMVEELNRRWAGQAIAEAPPVVVDGIYLVGGATTWPPRIRVRFRIRGEPMLWDQTFTDWPLEHGSPADAAATWAAIAWQNLVEFAEFGRWPRSMNRPQPVHEISERRTATG